MTRSFKETGIREFLAALESLTPIQDRLMRRSSLLALEFADATQGIGARMLDSGPNLSDIPRLLTDFEERHPGNLHPIEQAVVARFVAVVQDFRDTLAFKSEEARKLDPDSDSKDGPSLPEEYVEAERNFYLMRRRLVYRGQEELAVLLGQTDFQIVDPETRTQVPGFLNEVLEKHRKDFKRGEAEAIEEYAKSFDLLDL